MAEMSFSEARSTQPQRLTDPMVWRQGMKVPTSWEVALDLVARVTVAVIQEQGEDRLFVPAFDHSKRRSSSPARPWNAPCGAEHRRGERRERDAVD
jgi:anaerobic selenocysteine-containing dehydrogenase